MTIVCVSSQRFLGVTMACVSSQRFLGVTIKNDGLCLFTEVS